MDLQKEYEKAIINYENDFMSNVEYYGNYVFSKNELKFDYEEARDFYKNELGEFIKVVIDYEDKQLTVEEAIKRIEEEEKKVDFEKFTKFYLKSIISDYLSEDFYNDLDIEQINDLEKLKEVKQHLEDLYNKR